MPKAIEAQLKMGSAGDWLPSKATLTIENKGIQSVKRQNAEGAEKPRGEWNRGHYRKRQHGAGLHKRRVKNKGVDVYAHAGQICLQSEGGAIDFRNVTLEPLTNRYL